MRFRRARLTTAPIRETGTAERVIHSRTRNHLAGNSGPISDIRGGLQPGSALVANTGAAAPDRSPALLCTTGRSHHHDGRSTAKGCRNRTQAATQPPSALILARPASRTRRAGVPGSRCTRRSQDLIAAIGARVWHRFGRATAAARSAEQRKVAKAISDSSGGGRSKRASGRRALGARSWHPAATCGRLAWNGRQGWLCGLGGSQL